MTSLPSLPTIALIATTPAGAQLLETLVASLGATLYIPPTMGHIPHAKIYTGTLKEHLAALWDKYDAIGLCLATGAVVRLIAPLLTDKAKDPAILVFDEVGKYVISLCGGHQGGADRLTATIAPLLQAESVITGASHALGLSGIDTIGTPFGWRKGVGDWTAVSAAIARNESVTVIQTAGSTLWQTSLPPDCSFQFSPSEDYGNFSPLIHIGVTNTPPRRERPYNLAPAPPELSYPRVNWHPRLLWLGIGCERGSSTRLIRHAIEQTLAAYNLAPNAIAGIATIDLKADEVGLLAYCHQQNLPLQTYAPDRLKSIPVPNPSEVVAAEVGTPSVAEAAALVAAGVENLLVTKQKFRLTGEPGAVTIAIAQAEGEYTGRTGHLALVGTGPGHLDQITPAAKAAIINADVVIGYSLYIDLIRSLFRPGQIIEALPITQERQRAERAIALAEWGLNVAVVSSGDCGIYAMAGLVFEQLAEGDWDGSNPSIQVYPGISALQSAAALVGAPLMHDFCTISLSDLLTPWEVILKRLHAAAQGDFVTAFYNPKSQTRTSQIATAQEIFLQHRGPDTPVAIVRAAYRPEQQIYLTTLAEMLDYPIDMLTLVLIGNQTTKFHQGWMVTPRGYLVS